MGRVRVKRKKSRRERMMERQSELLHKSEQGKLSIEEAQELEELKFKLQSRDKRKGDGSPSAAQEQLIRQTYHYQRVVAALTQAIEMVKETLDEAICDDGMYRADLVSKVHEAMAGPQQLINWAAAEAERKAREEIEDEVVVSGDDDPGDVDDAGSEVAPVEADEEA